MYPPGAVDDRGNAALQAAPIMTGGAWRICLPRFGRSFGQVLGRSWGPLTVAPYEGRAPYKVPLYKEPLEGDPYEGPLAESPCKGSLQEPIVRAPERGPY